MINNLVIIGISETAEHLTSFVESYNLFNIIGYAVDRQYKTKEEFLGKPVFAIDDLPSIIDKEKDFLFVSLLWNHLNADRRKMYERLKAEGYRFANVISPTAIVRGKLNGDNIWIDDNVHIGAYSIVESDCLIKIGSLLGHHTHLGAHCFMGVKCLVAGACTIGEQTFIGINATIFGKLNIGKKCIVGACTAVKRDMPDCSVWKTSSDFVIKTYEESIIEEKLVSSKINH